MTRVLIVENEADGGSGLIGERLSAAAISQHVVGPETGRQVPQNAQGFDGVVVMGGAPGPMDDTEAVWLPRVRSLIGDCLERRVPLLGVCLGGQLLAVVAGGQVGPMNHGPEIGLHPIDLTEAARHDPLFGGLPARVRGIQWHHLEVQRLPAAVETLCLSPSCPIQAFRVGPVAWGLQFHLEAVATDVEAWMGSSAADLNLVGLSRQQLIDPVRNHEAELRSTWTLVADRWAEVVATSAVSGKD